ncbi:MAG: hypothetical protein R2713_11225 [Ilumatobacteraceae bacterium]
MTAIIASSKPLLDPPDRRLDVGDLLTLFVLDPLLELEQAVGGSRLHAVELDEQGVRVLVHLLGDAFEAGGQIRGELGQPFLDRVSEPLVTFVHPGRERRRRVVQVLHDRAGLLVLPAVHQVQLVEPCMHVGERPLHVVSHGLADLEQRLRVDPRRALRDLLLQIGHPPVLVVGELGQPLLERGLQCLLVVLVGHTLRVHRRLERRELGHELGAQLVAALLGGHACRLGLVGHRREVLRELALDGREDGRGDALDVALRRA